MLGRKKKNSGKFHTHTETQTYTHSELPNYKSECTPQNVPLTVSRQWEIKITAHNPHAYATDTHTHKRT